jgi:hypothetical protein
VTPKVIAMVRAYSGGRAHVKPRGSRGERALEWASLRGRRLPLLALVLAGSALLVGTASASAPAARPDRILLSLGDLGSTYSVKFIARRTLIDVSSGDSASVRQELARSWIAGAEQSFRAKKVDRGVISQADVFRQGARLDLILRAWQRDVLRISHGTLQDLPTAAPGTGGALMRGHLFAYELLIYMWRHGRAISSVDVTGLNGTVPVSLVMKLARVQDARMASAS